jgi:DNA-3-methyladenine glycosylase I
MPRCFWCTDDPLYQAYHDEEWGVPQRDPRALFEMLLLEGAQAGLSWITVLKKRERYRQVLHGFEPECLARLSDEEIEALMQEPGIIRNRLKLKAVRQNAQAWLKLEDPVTWLWSFVGGAPGQQGEQTEKADHQPAFEDQPFQRPQPDAGGDARGRGDEQGVTQGGLQLRRADHLLCLHAGHGHGDGPHHRL